MACWLELVHGCVGRMARSPELTAGLSELIDGISELIAGLSELIDGILALTGPCAALPEWA